jgi:hypothetical protein
VQTAKREGVVIDSGRYVFMAKEVLSPFYHTGSQQFFDLLN